MSKLNTDPPIVVIVTKHFTLPVVVAAAERAALRILLLACLSRAPGEPLRKACTQRRSEIYVFDIVTGTISAQSCLPRQVRWVVLFVVSVSEADFSSSLASVPC